MLAVFYWIAFPVLALTVACALYGDKLTALFAGSGKRRFTVESAGEADKTIKGLRVKLAAAKARPCANCGHLPAWPTDAALAESDATDEAGTVSVKAPVDSGCRDRPATAAETVRDASLAAMALPGEEEMAAELYALRASNAVTQVFAIVPDQPAVPDPAEVALNIPGPHPLASATAIPVTAALNAVTKVTAALAERQPS